MKLKLVLRRTLPILLALGLSLSLVSCGGGPAVMTWDGEKITEGEFKYYLATYKSRFARTYSDFTDSEAFYRQPVGDVTAEEFLFDTVKHNVGLSLLCDGLFKEYGLTLSRSVTDEVDEYVNSFLEDYAGGSRNVLNQALSTYGINARMLREIYLRDERATALFNHLYGSDGVIGLNDAERAAYLEENYARVRHLYINTAYMYAVDENGDPVIGEDGYQKQIPLEGETLEAKLALCAAVDEALSAGEDFDEVYEASSEDKYYPHGYYLTRNMDFITGVVSSAFDLEIGEWTKVESEVGVHWILRLPLEEKPWADEESADFFENYDEEVAGELFTEMLEAKLGEIEYNEEILSRYSVQASPVNSKF